MADSGPFLIIFQVIILEVFSRCVLSSPSSNSLPRSNHFSIYVQFKQHLPLQELLNVTITKIIDS